MLFTIIKEPHKFIIIKGMIYHPYFKCPWAATVQNLFWGTEYNIALYNTQFSKYSKNYMNSNNNKFSLLTKRSDVLNKTAKLLLNSPFTQQDLHIYSFGKQIPSRIPIPRLSYTFIMWIKTTTARKFGIIATFTCSELN